MLILILAKAALLTLHLVMMNLASAGPIVAIFLDSQFRRKANATANRLGKRLVTETLLAAVVGTVAGFAIGLILFFSASERLFSAINIFWYRIWWGIWEIAFYFVCVYLYLRWWLPRPDSAKRIWGHRFLAILAATNFLYHFPPLFTLIAQHEPTPLDSSPATSAEFRALLCQPHVVAFSLHFALASIAICGVRVMQLASKQLDDEGMLTAKLGALCALVPSIMQLFVGFWLTIVFPNSRSVLGGNLWATGGLMISVLLALQLLSELGGVVFGEISARSIRKCSHLMMAIVTVMTWTLVLIQN